MRRFTVALIVVVMCAIGGVIWGARTAPLGGDDCMIPAGFLAVVTFHVCGFGGFCFGLLAAPVEVAADESARSVFANRLASRLSPQRDSDVLLRGVGSDPALLRTPRAGWVRIPCCYPLVTFEAYVRVRPV